MALFSLAEHFVWLDIYYYRDDSGQNGLDSYSVVGSKVHIYSDVLPLPVPRLFSAKVKFSRTFDTSPLSHYRRGYCLLPALEQMRIQPVS